MTGPYYSMSKLNQLALLLFSCLILLLRCLMLGVHNTKRTLDASARLIFMVVNIYGSSLRNESAIQLKYLIAHFKVMNNK